MSAEQKAGPVSGPAEILKALPTVRERVIVEGHEFLIERPDEVQRIPNHPAVRATFAEGEYIPFWTDLWPAARMLAKVILREPLPAGAEVLEVGCGLGLPGVVALARGLRVTFSDYDAAALEFAARNARLNGFQEFRVLRLDWRDPPPDLRVPMVLGSDLIYEVASVVPLVGLLKRVLLPGGQCLLTDQERVPSQHLRDTLAAEGLAFTTQTVRAGEPGGRRFKGTLYRIKNSGERRVAGGE
jgi:predicted nicotinamide N-methyase